MNHLHILLNIGANKPFKLIHASDTHITFADARDDERKIRLSETRARVFPRAFENLEEIGHACEEDGAVLAYTGDLIDFVSEKNLDVCRDFINHHDTFFTAGNHEFSLYVGEAWEDEAYRNQSLAKVQSCFTNDIRMSSRTINGVKLIALDNSYYLFDPDQLAFLKKECAEGLPVILLLHTPLYTPELHEFMMIERKQPCGYLCGTPFCELKNYPEYRQRQQTPDRTTLDTFDFISACTNIKVLLTGHNHVSVVSTFAGRIPQYTIGLEDIAHIKVN